MRRVRHEESCKRVETMQNLKSMGATGTALVQGPAKPDGYMDEIVSIRLIPPLPYSTTLIPAEKLRETIFQIARERQGQRREAALNGSSQ
jgi:hypothetical protein